MKEGVKIAAAVAVIALLAANLGTTAVGMLDKSVRNVASTGDGSPRPEQPGHRGSQPQKAADNPEQRANTEVAQPPPAPSGLPAVEAVDTAKYKPPCRQPQDHDACDLEAQWKAADAARDAASRGWWQMVFSAFGLAGLLYSLVLTRRATNVAVAATKDADKALPRPTVERDTS
jgi:hypothetical protein